MQMQFQGSKTLDGFRDPKLWMVSGIQNFGRLIVNLNTLYY